MVARTDFMQQNPGVLPRIIKMYKDAGDFIRDNPKEADAIVSSGKYASKGVSAGTIIAEGQTLTVSSTTCARRGTKTANTQLWKMLDVKAQKRLDPDPSRAGGYPQLRSLRTGFFAPSKRQTRRAP